MKSRIALFIAVGLATVFATASAFPPENLSKKLYADYKKWTRVNTEPFYITSYLMGLCAGSPPEVAIAEHRSEHKGMFINVYANSTAQAAMKKERDRTFPQGSVIVKEKLAKKDDRSAAALGIMVKRDEKTWEFLYQDKDKVVGGDAVAHCEACHRALARPDRDLVFYPEPVPVRNLGGYGFGG